MLIGSLKKKKGGISKSLLLLLSFLLVSSVFMMSFQHENETGSLCTCSGHPAKPRCDNCKD